MSNQYNDDALIDDKEAEIMCRAYIGESLERICNDMCQKQIGIELHPDIIMEILTSLRQLRRFYYQKFIPRRRITDLEDLIMRLEKKMPVG